MKSTLLALLCSAILAVPATFDIGWDARPASDGVTGHRVYIGPTNAPVAIISYGPTNRASITLQDGAYQIRVSATNAVDESLLSLPIYIVVYGTNVVAITTRPGAPLNVQLR